MAFRFLTWLVLGLALAGAATAQPRPSGALNAELAPMSVWAAPGSTAIVAVRQQIAPGWHTYWRNPGDSGGATELSWSLPPGVEAGDILWPAPERQPLQGLMNYGYSGEVFLPVPIKVPAAARPGDTLPLAVEATFFVCSDQMCVPETHELRLALPVGEGAAPLHRDHGRAIARVVREAPRPGALTASWSREADGLRLSVAGEPLAGAANAYFFPFEPRALSHPAEQSGERGPDGLTLRLTPGTAPPEGVLAGVLQTDAGAWEIAARPGAPLPGTTGDGRLTLGASPLLVLQALGFALLGGLILNLMPCVFPVLSMKAAALAEAAHAPAAARRDGLAFLAGVLTTFLGLAGLLIALRAGGAAIGWGFQLQSPPVTAGLALLMLAVGLNLSGVYHMGVAAQGVGGRLAGLPGGTGAFFTGALAVLVAAPCTAPFMAFAMGAALTFPAPLALAVFAMLGVGLALPFVLLSFSPRLMRRLPAPGPWMLRLKALLAFPMYGAALWLTWVFARQTDAQALALLFAAGLTLALGAYLRGRVQEGRAAGERTVATTVAALIALIAAVALAVAAARVPASRAVAPASADSWSPEAVAEAQAAGRPVLVNFTADWCVTCKINERTALSGAAVAEALDATGTRYLVADWTRREPRIGRELERHGRSGVPLYLVYRPGEAEPRILPQLLTEGLVVEALRAAAVRRPEPSPAPAAPG